MLLYLIMFVFLVAKAVRATTVRGLVTLLGIALTQLSVTTAVSLGRVTFHSLHVYIRPTLLELD